LSKVEFNFDKFLFKINTGIGVEVSHQELLDIASPGDDYTPQYVFSVNNFNALYSIVSQLVALTCDGKSSILYWCFLSTYLKYKSRPDFKVFLLFNQITEHRVVRVFRIGV